MKRASYRVKNKHGIHIVNVYYNKDKTKDVETRQEIYSLNASVYRADPIHIVREIKAVKKT